MGFTCTLSGWTGGTLDLNDQANYSVVKNGLMPTVSRRRRRLLGGPLYDDVVQQMDLYVFGATPAACLTNLHNLAAAIDQADRFRLREPVDPVIWNFQPEGSALSQALQYLVLGPADTGSWLQLRPSFNFDLRTYIIGPFALSFVCRGMGMYLQTQQSAISAYAAYPITVTFSAAAALPSPVRVEFAESAAGYNVVTGYLAFANAANKLQFEEAEDLTGLGDGGTWDATVNESANQASLTYVHRYTADTDADEAELGGLAVTVPDRHVAVFALLRNNSAATEWLLTVQATGPGMSNQRTRGVIVDGSLTTPQWVPLGTVYSRQGVDEIDIIVQPSTASGSPSIDFDQIFVIGVDDPATSRIIKFEPVVEGSTGLGTGTYLLVDPKELEDLVPFVGAGGSGGERPCRAYQGDAYLMSDGLVLATAALLTNATYWRSYAGGGLVQYTVTAKRRAAYATPQ